MKNIKIIDVSYAAIIACHTSSGAVLSYVQKTSDPSTYELFLATKDVCLAAYVEGDNVTPFESAYKAKAVAASSTADAYALSLASRTDLHAPVRDSSGKQIVLPNIFPGDVTLYYTGAGDDIDAENPSIGVGDGAEMSVQSTTIETKDQTIGFIDWIYVAGGGVTFKDAVKGDWASLSLMCPATPVEEAAENDGNCNVNEETHKITPADGDGTHNVDLELARPFPAFDPDGEMIGDYVWVESPAGPGVILKAVDAGLTAGNAPFNLYTVEKRIARFANKLPLVGTGVKDILVPAIKPKKILPQWRFKVELHNSTEKTLDFSWYLVTARLRTTD